MQEHQTFNADSDAVRAHLSILQGVIQRMAENGRSCKVWCVTLVSAVLVLTARTGEADHAFIALIPSGLLWVLDAYYLGLERGFRSSYDEFVEKVHRSALSLEDLYSVAPTGSTAGRFFWAMARSVAVAPFYLMVVVTVIIAWGVIV